MLRLYPVKEGIYFIEFTNGTPKIVPDYKCRRPCFIRVIGLTQNDVHYIDIKGQNPVFMEVVMEGWEMKEKLFVRFGLKMVESGLTTGTGGNLSVIDRNLGKVAVSPSGIEYSALQPRDVVLTDMDGNIMDGSCRPSSELGFHLAIYRQRKDVQAVVHTHSPYATTMACLGWEIPAVHYLVGFSGKKVPLAPYATFGTPELADIVAEHIGEYNALLLANHGACDCWAETWMRPLRLPKRSNLSRGYIIRPRVLEILSSCRTRRWKPCLKSSRPMGRKK